MPTGKRNFEATITTRYGVPEKDIYQQVIDLVEKERIAKSRAQLLLVKRGLAHMGNPEPLIKEKVVYRDREVPVEKIVEKVVYKSPPKVDKSTPQEHVGIEDHIIDEPVKADLQNAGQRASADKLTTRDKADPPSPSTALEKEKSAKEGNGIGGWIALGGFLAVIFGPVVYSWFTK